MRGRTVALFGAIACVLLLSAVVAWLNPNASPVIGAITVATLLALLASVASYRLGTRRGINTRRSDQPPAATTREVEWRSRATLFEIQQRIVVTGVCGLVVVACIIAILAIAVNDEFSPVAKQVMIALLVLAVCALGFAGALASAKRTPLLPGSGVSISLLLVSAAPMPQIAAVITVVCYVSSKEGAFVHDHAVGLGLVTATVVWLSVPIFFRAFATARADLGAYGELRVRTSDLIARLAAIRSRSGSPPGAEGHIGQVQPASHSAIRALAEIGDHVRILERQLRFEWSTTSDDVQILHQGDSSTLPPTSEQDARRRAVGGDARWAIGTFYVDLWRRVHLAEEAMLEVEPSATVRAAIAQDRLRLARSTIVGKQSLLDLLDKAEKRLKSKAAAGRSEQEELGRALLRRVRHAINEYQDARREGFVRLRAETLRTATLLAVGTYLLLAIAVLGHIDSDMMRSIAAYFLIGYAVGLARRLWALGRSSRTIHDYGASIARLASDSLLSGVAALMGVVIVALLGYLTPSLGSAGCSECGVTSMDFGQVFDVSTNFVGIIAAAAFGLAPSVLLRQLDRLATQYTADLLSMQPASTLDQSLDGWPER